jgi:hypothetical protein
MIWIEWIVKHWRVVGGIVIVIAVWSIILSALLKPKVTLAPQPAIPHVDAVKIDTTQTRDAAVIESKHDEKRRVKVRVIVPPETVIGGDSAMVIEIVIEDSSKSEASVEDIKIVDRGLSESITVAAQEVVPVVKRERVLGVIGGVGYLIPDNDLIPHVGLSLRVYNPVYLCASAGWHDEVIGIGSIAVKVGNLFGLKILFGTGYSTDRQGVVSLSIGG